MSGKIHSDSGDKIPISFQRAGLEGKLVYLEGKKEYRLTVGGLGLGSAKVTDVACKILDTSSAGTVSKKPQSWREKCSAIYDYVFCKKIIGEIATINGPRSIEILVNKSSLKKHAKTSASMIEKPAEIFDSVVNKIEGLNLKEIMNQANSLPVYSNELVEIQSISEKTGESSDNQNKMFVSANKVARLFSGEGGYLLKEAADGLDKGAIVMESQDKIGKGGENIIYKTSVINVENTAGPPVVLRKPIAGSKPSITERLSKIYNKLKEIKGLALPSILRWKESQTVEVVKYYNAGTLLGLSKKDPNDTITTIEQKKSVVGQILTQVSAVHQAGVLHLDIKPENILVNREENDQVVVGLADFGCAKELEGGTVKITASHQGTLTYTPPEEFQCNDWKDSVSVELLASNMTGGRDTISVTAARDSWQVGLVFYEFLSGTYPEPIDVAFREGIDMQSSRKMRQQLILQFNDPSKYQAWYDRECKRLDRDLTLVTDPKLKQRMQLEKLTMQLLHPDPKKRVSVQAALEAFNRI